MPKISINNFEYSVSMFSERGPGITLDLIAIIKFKDDVSTTTFRVTTGPSKDHLIYQGPSINTAIKKYNAFYDALTLL